MTDPATGGSLPVALRLLDPRLRDWGFPRWGSAGAAGLDLHACLDADLILMPGSDAVLIPAGFTLMIRDPSWCGLIFPRSGLGHRDGLVLGNGVGVIDADYEGPLLISAWNRTTRPEGGITIRPGDRIAQLVFTRVIRPDFVIEEVGRELGGTPAGSGRGVGGFGSTGLR